jgi:hypothetical protein
MTRRARGLLGLVALVALLGPLLVDALWTSDEERVETALAAMESALEARDAGRLVEWFEPDVEGRFPGASTRRSVAESVRSILEDEVAALGVEREETTVAFPEPGRARVGVNGFVHVEVDGTRMPLRFESELELRKADDGRFLLQKIVRVVVKPIFG